MSPVPDQGRDEQFMAEALVLARAAERVAELTDLLGLERDMLHRYPAALLQASVRAATPGQRLPTVEGQPPSLPGTFLPCAFAPRCGWADERCRSVEPTYPWPADEGAACHHPTEEQP